MIKKIILYFALLHLSISCIGGNSISLISWNIRDFGKTKNKEEILAIADILKDFDIVAIQEVVAGYGGAQAAARLAEELNRKGSKWDYWVSNSTNSPPYKTERYAFLWKVSKVALIGRPWLDTTYETQIFREPYLVRFRSNDKEFIVINFHSRRYNENPEIEVRLLDDIAANYLPTPCIIAGDFNMSERHVIFDELRKQGYISLLNNQLTTLKRKCPAHGNDYLNLAIDNIFYPKQYFKLLDGGVIDFVCDCRLLEGSRLISDHLPVWLNIEF